MLQFDHDLKELMGLYEELLRQAAEHQILLVFHGANKPTGRARTWPNEMVREAVKGMETKNLADRARHQTILPFTRYLAGGADDFQSASRRHDLGESDRESGHL